MGSTGTSIGRGILGGGTAPQDNTPQSSDSGDIRDVTSFRNADIDTAADYTAALPRTTDPDLNTSSWNRAQTLIDRLGMHEKPEVVTDAEFDSRVANEALDGMTLYRGFGTQHDSAVIDSFKFGDKTYIGDGVHGNGIYFTTRKRYAKQYSGGLASNSTVTAFINKAKARVISEDTLRSQFASESRSIRSRFNPSGDSDDAIAMYAVYRGYNVIYARGGNFSGSGRHNTHSGDFYIPLTRDVLVVRDNTQVR